MSQVDFVDRYDDAQLRHKFKERLGNLLLKRNIELLFVRWTKPSWLLTINYQGSVYTLRAKLDLARRGQYAISTIKHLKDRVVFWKDIVDEREANHGEAWR